LVTQVRNEARNIAWALEQIADDVSEIVLVDRNSTDATLITARSCRPGIKVVPQEGIGKGSALGAGFLAATGDIIVTMDRGRQHCEGPLNIVSAAWQPAEWVVRRWWAKDADVNGHKAVCIGEWHPGKRATAWGATQDDRYLEVSCILHRHLFVVAAGRGYR
jgi:hypothetical protein